MDDVAPKQIRIDAVWDIETENWDTFVVGALWTASEGTKVYRDEASLAGALLGLPKGSVAWAHAGGRFDVLWLLDWCYRNDALPESAQIRMSGSTISALSIKGGPILRDSFRLIPMSLAKACRMFDGQRKTEVGLQCICGKSCGGYCSISRKMSRGDMAKLTAYLVSDVEALRDTLIGLVTYCDGHGITLAGTVAGSSWKSASAMCGLVPADWELPAYREARKGYYGGRVDVGMTAAPLIYRFDRQSAYPAALTGPVPVGLPTLSDGPAARLAYGKGRPGIYSAFIDVPESHACPLPYRVANRIAYPWGKLRGTWPRDEIQHAEALGARIIKFDSAVTWPEDSAALRPYVEYVFKLRHSAPTKELGQWLKWLANSLTGAFATDPEQDLFAIGDKADEAQWSSVGAHDWLWRRTVFRIADRAHVQWAGTLTARARIELHNQILHSGTNWCYSDTDSVYGTETLTRNVGTGLGEWNFEGTGRDFVALAPKLYRYTTEDGKTHARAKGIPAAEKAWGALAEMMPVDIDTGVKSFLVAAGSGGPLFKRQHTHRRLGARTEWVGARLRDGTTATRAPAWADLARLPR